MARSARRASRRKTRGSKNRSYRGRARKSARTSRGSRRTSYKRSHSRASRTGRKGHKRASRKGGYTRFGRKRSAKYHAGSLKYRPSMATLMAMNKKLGINPRRGRKSRRNPGLERTLRDGTVLELHEHGDHGIVYVHHTDGSMDDFKLPWKKAMSKFKAYKSGGKYGRRAEADAWRDLATNPRRGRKTRRNCGMTKDPRYATTRIIRKGSRRNCGMSRRNPAQFPMPFMSAMNPRISRKEARGMGRVLRRHGYKRCRV